MGSWMRWLSVRAVGVAALGFAFVLLPAPRALAEDPPATPPTVSIDDGPFVRSQVVELRVLTDFAPGGPQVVERRASNTPTTDLGVLSDGVPVVPIGPWSLEAGPPGPRTVYAQVLYSNGVWSAVVSVTVTADFTIASRLYLDLEPRPDPNPPADMDWHEVVVSPPARVIASGGPLGSVPGTYVHVKGGDWGVGLQVSAGTIAAGTYHPVAATGSGAPSPVAAIVVGRDGSCYGAGEFVIHEVVLDLSGDVRVLDADFVLTCFNATMGGAIRYGTTRPLSALDQTADRLFSGLVPIGDRASIQSVNMTNVGTVPATLGTARLEGATGDFVIEIDGCGGRTLAVGATCVIDTAFVPAARGMRTASLLVPDPTVRGERKVTLIGWGLQPVSLEVEATSLPQYGPAPATFVVTLTPPATSDPVLFVAGRQLTGPAVSTAPDRVTYTYTTVVNPGTQDARAEFREADFFEPATTSIEVTVGTATTLTLGTVADDGVAEGEAAPLIARLDTGAPLNGGTLRIRNSATGAIAASMGTFGEDPALTWTALQPLGSHPYTAEFLPADPSVQASSAPFSLVVVPGPRPETAMDASTVYSNVASVQSSFTSPTPGVTFQCRLWLNAWHPCTSPATWNTSWGGEHLISVRAVRPDGLADRTPASRTWIVDFNPPVGSVDIVGGGQYTRSRTVTLDVPGHDAYPVSHLRLTNNWSSETTIAYAPRVVWTLPAEDRTHTIGVWWRDAAGSWSNPASATITLDTTAPRVSAPVHRLLSGHAVSGGRMPVGLTWTGSDATSGIARFELAQGTNGGAYAVVSTSLTSPSQSVLLTPGRTYRFRVRALDRAGNASAWVYGPTFRLSAVQQSSTAIAYGGTWRTTTSTSYWGGSAKYATAAGARARIRVTGRSFAWVAAVGPTRGSARIYVNGVYLRTVSLHAPTSASRRVVFVQHWSSSATRTIEIRVVGTSGRPRVDLDAFAWGS